jgi:hypothetical protein
MVWYVIGEALWKHAMDKLTVRDFNCNVFEALSPYLFKRFKEKIIQNKHI